MLGCITTIMALQTPKKVLFLITKSNWGEKWEGTHFARLIEDLHERSEIKGPMSGQNL